MKPGEPQRRTAKFSPAQFPELKEQLFQSTTCYGLFSFHSKKVEYIPQDVHYPLQLYRRNNEVYLQKSFFFKKTEKICIFKYISISKILSPTSRKELSHSSSDWTTVPTWADFFVGGIARVASCEAHLGWIHAFQEPELALSPPEAAHSCREQSKDKSWIQNKAIPMCHHTCRLEGRSCPAIWWSKRPKGFNAGDV